MKGWIKVYSADEEYQAAIVKALLENNGLNPVMVDRKDDGFRIGYAELYTAPQEADRALEIIITSNASNKEQS